VKVESALGRLIRASRMGRAVGRFGAAVVVAARRSVAWSGLTADTVLRDVAYLIALVTAVLLGWVAFSGLTGSF
jgi:hypothetical protein